MLIKEQIDEILGNEYNRLCAEEGYTGSMGGVAWDRAAARAIETVVRREALQDAANIPFMMSARPEFGLEFHDKMLLQAQKRILELIDQPAELPLEHIPDPAEMVNADELPLLPEPTRLLYSPSNGHIYGYTIKQIQQYARNAIATDRAKREQPPKWYSRDEIVGALRNMNYSEPIAQELADWFVRHLQLAFNRGFYNGSGQSELAIAKSMRETSLANMETMSKQRDELLAALKGLEHAFSDEYDDGELKAMDAARAAIVKAEAKS